MIEENAAALESTAGKLEGLQGKLGGVDDSLTTTQRSLEETGSKAEKSMSRIDEAAGRTEGVLGRLGNAANSIGIPFGNALLAVQNHMRRVAAENDTMAAKVGTASKYIGVAGIAGFIAAGAEATHMAMDFEAAGGQIAAAADISVNKGRAIANSFLQMGGSTKFTAQQVADSYVTVAGQLGLMEGRALSAQQALDFMRTSTTLAEASNSQLGVTTKSLAGVMQGFEVPTSQAATTADQLFNAARVTGVTISQLAATMERLHARMGMTVPSVKSMSTMLIDLAEHGVTGSRGLMIMNSAMNTLVTAATGMSQAQTKAADVQSGKVAKAQQAVTAADLGLIAAQQKVAASATGTAAQQASAAARVTAEKIKLAGVEQKLQAVQARAPVVANASVQGMINLGLHVFDTQGKFVGFGSIIQQLYPHLQGLNQEQQLVMLSSIGLKTQGKALLDTFNAGPAAWDKAAAAVERHGSAQKAAEAETSNLRGSEEKLRAAVDDLGVSFGEKVLPSVVAVTAKLATGVGWLAKHKDVLIAFAIGVGSIFAVALAVTAVRAIQKFGDATEKALAGFGKWGQKLNDIIPGLNRVKSADEQMAASFDEAMQKVGQTADDAHQLFDMLEGDFLNLADSAEQHFGRVSRAAEEADAAVEQAMVGGSVTSSVTKAADVVSTASAQIVGDFDEIGAAADGMETQIAASTGAAEGQLDALAVTADTAGAATAAGETAAGAGGVAGEGALLTRLGGGGAALSKLFLPAMAGMAAFQGATAVLHSNVLGLGTDVTHLGDKIANLFGGGPGSGQAFDPHGDTTMGDATKKFLEEVALGLVKAPPGISKATALGDLHRAGVTDQQIAAAKPALEAAFSPAAKYLMIVANNLQIAADKQLLWVTAARGVHDKSSKAAEKTLEANIKSLETQNQQLEGVKQVHVAADTHQKAAAAHLNAAQLHANSAKAASISASDTSKASADLSKAADAVVKGHAKIAQMWEQKAAKLDKAATDMMTAAEEWAGGMFAALAQKGPAYPGEYTGMNAPPSSKPVMMPPPPGPQGGLGSVLPHHAAGGVAFGTSFGVFGESGTEAILPLTSSRAMSAVGSAIAEAMPSSMSTVFHIENLVVVAQNPQQLSDQLQQRARVSALSSTPSGSHNLAVAV